MRSNNVTQSGKVPGNNLPGRAQDHTSTNASVHADTESPMTQRLKLQIVE